jgi:hypothetical protein
MLQPEGALDLHPIRWVQRVIVGVCDELEALRSDRVNFGELVSVASTRMAGTSVGERQQCHGVQQHAGVGDWTASRVQGGDPKDHQANQLQEAAHPQVTAAAHQIGGIGAHEHGIQKNAFDQPECSAPMQGRQLCRKRALGGVRAHRGTTEQALQLFRGDQGLGA